MDDTTKRRALLSVAVSVVTDTTTDQNVYFKPTSPTATIALYQGGPVGVDTEYLMFGYWREDPTSPAGTYQFKTFAEVVAPSVFSGSVNTFAATYDGIAVGAYVEKDPNAAVDTYRQGEFTADVYLSATGTAENGRHRHHRRFQDHADGRQHGAQDLGPLGADDWSS